MRSMEHSPRTDEPTLSAIGLGTSRIGSFNNPASLRESRALIRAALDAGITTFDTSNIYGQGDSERTIGRALAGARDRTFLVTKTGLTFSAKYAAARWLKPLIRPVLARAGKGASVVSARRDDAMGSDWTPARFAASLDASLRRLRTDRVDGFLLHSPPAAVIRDAAVGAALAALKAAGKVRHFGISCDDEAGLEAALAIPGLSIVQLPWDLIARMGVLSDALQARRVIVLAREVVALQPGRPPEEAIAASVAHPAVSCTLVGTTRADRLPRLAALAGTAAR